MQSARTVCAYIDPLARPASRSHLLSHINKTVNLTGGGHSADNRPFQGVPRQGAETPAGSIELQMRMIGARKPFEPDPGRAGVGTGTFRQKPTSSSQLLPGLRSTSATEIHNARFRSTPIREAHAEGRGASGHDGTAAGLAQGLCAGP